MPSLKVLDTANDVPAIRILAGAFLATSLLAAVLPAQRAVQKRGGRAAGSVETLTAELVRAYYERFPDRAVQERRVGEQRAWFGTFGVEATLRWGDALERLRSRLPDPIPETSAPLGVERIAALAARVRGELLLLDAQPLVRMDPVGYVDRVQRTLWALEEASDLSPARRSQLRLYLFESLPAYWKDARASLISPVPGWMDVARLAVSDLQEFLQGLETPALPEEEKQRYDAAFLRAQEATRSFERWLLEERNRAGTFAPVLGAENWLEVVRSFTGSSWTAAEIKARCLRDLSGGHADDEERALVALDPQRAAETAGNAAAHAVGLAQGAGFLRAPFAARAFEVVFEEGPRSRPELARVTTQEGRARLVLWGPNSTWSRPRQETRLAALQQPAQVALGLRHGLTGESLLLLRARGRALGSAGHLLNRAVLGGLGLYALDWLRRIEGPENPYRTDEALERELARQHTLEAARLLAALELHAEALSLDEVADNFVQRTGADVETARAEALAAQRDPLAGIGQLGFHELRALEEELVSATDRSPSEAVASTLSLVTMNPDLRPADLRSALEHALPR